MAPNTAYIGLGSNLGDSARLLLAAWQYLGRQPGITLDTLSSPYRSEPVGMVSANWFINAAGRLHTDLSPLHLLTCLLAVEEGFGRQRPAGGHGYRDRTLDLDLLLYGNLEQAGPELVLPHPELAHRLFVLLPLAEIAPDLRHPTLGRTMRELLRARQALPDNPACLQTSWPQGE